MKLRASTFLPIVTTSHFSNRGNAIKPYTLDA